MELTRREGPGSVPIAATDGAVAQMGERLTGSQEVAGSIPASSTYPQGAPISTPRESALAATVTIPLRQASAA